VSCHVAAALEIAKTAPPLRTVQRRALPEARAHQRQAGPCTARDIDYIPAPTLRSRRRLNDRARSSLSTGGLCVPPWHVPARNNTGQCADHRTGTAQLGVPRARTQPASGRLSLVCAVPRGTARRLASLNHSDRVRASHEHAHELKKERARFLVYFG